MEPGKFYLIEFPYEPFEMHVECIEAGDDENSDYPLVRDIDTEDIGHVRLWLADDWYEVTAGNC